jgi:hypothetical protein
VKGRQGANGMAPVTALLALSPIPSLAFISFVCTYLHLLILHRIAPPRHMSVREPLRRGVVKGSKVSPRGFKAA